MDCSLPGSSVHGIFQARVLEWGAIAFSHILESEVEMVLFRIFRIVLLFCQAKGDALGFCLEKLQVPIYIFKLHSEAVYF